MDQMTTKLPLSKQVEECVNANMTGEDGSRYVNIYPAAYSLIARLSLIRDQHTNPQIRLEAKNLLDQIDLNGGVGTAYRAAYRFSMVNKIKVKPSRSNAIKGLRKLNLFEHTRITEFASRTDLDEDETSEIKRIQSSIVEGKIASPDYEKLKIIFAKYHPVIRRAGDSNGKRHGWVKMDEKTSENIKQLLERPDVSNIDKKAIFKIMEGLHEGRIQRTDYYDVARILGSNRATKKELAKRDTASRTFTNAVFVACQASNNLDEMKMPILPRAIRVDLATKISEAAMNMMQLQNKLLQEEDNGDG